MTLSGVAPSIEARRTLHAIAIATFPNAVPADTMRVAGGAPSAHWRDAAADAIAALAPFENAEVHFDDENITFTVRGSQAAIANLRQHYQSPPAAFNARIDVTETMP